MPGDPLLSELLADYTERHALTLRSPETAQFHAYRIGQWVEGRRASEAREVAAEIRDDLLPEAPGQREAGLEDAGVRVLHVAPAYVGHACSSALTRARHSAAAASLAAMIGRRSYSGTSPAG